MSAIRRKALQTAERLPSTTRQSVRRYSSAEHGKTGDQVHHFAGSSTEHGHHHAGPKEESLGTGFFMVLGAIPVSIGIYTLSQPSADGTPSKISSIINSYSQYKEKWAARNSLHTAMIEQAAFDRNLFQSSKGSAHVDLRFPECFNAGSPYNTIAGQSPRKMEEVVAHYEKLNAEAEEKKIKALESKR